MTELYTRAILRLAAEVPGRVGFDVLEEAGELRSRSCGARVRVKVALDAEGRVIALSQAVEACAFGQAAAALMGSVAEGRTLADADALVADVAAWLAGAEGPELLAPLDPVRDRPGRHEAVLLPFRALASAIREAGRRTSP